MDTAELELQRHAEADVVGYAVDHLHVHARALDVDYVLLDTSQPVDQVLSTYLTRRSARAKTGGA